MNYDFIKNQQFIKHIHQINQKEHIIILQLINLNCEIKIRNMQKQKSVNIIIKTVFKKVADSAESLTADLKKEQNTV